MKPSEKDLRQAMDLQRNCHHLEDEAGNIEVGICVECAAEALSLQYQKGREDMAKEAIRIVSSYCSADNHQWQPERCKCSKEAVEELRNLLKEGKDKP